VKESEASVVLSNMQLGTLYHWCIFFVNDARRENFFIFRIYVRVFLFFGSVHNIIESYG
jgi:hypothetical protein